MTNIFLFVDIKLEIYTQGNGGPRFPCLTLALAEICNITLPSFSNESSCISGNLNKIKFEMVEWFHCMFEIPLSI
jgi:hypothetical protein